MNLDTLAMVELAKIKQPDPTRPKRVISIVTLDTGEPLTTVIQAAAFIIYVDGVPYIWNHEKLPLQREWQSLTDEEIATLWADTEQRLLMKDFARAIEAKLKEKNT